jgi:ribosomal protein S18 acetylase RimI-like enzyme
MIQHSALMKEAPEPHIRIARIKKLELEDIENLCSATHDAIADGIGFNWLTPPSRETLESYWRGVMMVPERVLIGAWLDGVLCGAIQLVKPSRSKETSYFCANIEAHFVAPWARGHGMAIKLLEQAEREATMEGFSVIRLNVRETQEVAIKLYEDHGYIKWGVLPCHEFVAGRMIAGHYFYKPLQPASSIE